MSSWRWDLIFLYIRRIPKTWHDQVIICFDPFKHFFSQGFQQVHAFEKFLEEFIESKPKLFYNRNNKWHEIWSKKFWITTGFCQQILDLCINRIYFTRFILFSVSEIYIMIRLFTNLCMCARACVCERPNSRERERERSERKSLYIFTEMSLVI